MDGPKGNAILGVNDFKVEKVEEDASPRKLSANIESKQPLDKGGLVEKGEEDDHQLGGGESEMAPMAGSSIHRSGSRPQLDLSKAAIQENSEEKDPTILLPNQSDDISYLALDIGGSLIKLVYFSRHEDRSTDDKRKKKIKERLGISNGNRRSYPILGGRLHFVKFETNKINECLDFISSKQLHHGGIDFPQWSSEVSANENVVIKVNVPPYPEIYKVMKEVIGDLVLEEFKAERQNAPIMEKSTS